MSGETRSWRNTLHLQAPPSRLRHAVIPDCALRHPTASGRSGEYPRRRRIAHLTRTRGIRHTASIPSIYPPSPIGVTQGGGCTHCRWEWTDSDWNARRSFARPPASARAGPEGASGVAAHPPHAASPAPTPLEVACCLPQLAPPWLCYTLSGAIALRRSVSC